MISIHPAACIDSTVRIGQGVTVGPRAVVEAGVVLGDGVEIMAGAVVMGPTTLGNGCRVFPGAVLGAEPQRVGEPSKEHPLLIGEGNTFREGSTAHRGMAGPTRIGDHNLFMAQSHVGHDCQVGSGCVLANSVALAGHAVVDDKAVLGGLSGVHQYARVGRLAMVGAGAMVSQDVPPFCLVQGDRARLWGLNRVGLARAGFTPGAVSAIRKAFRKLFLEPGSRREALASLEALASSVPEVGEMVSFVMASERGVCRPRRPGDRE